MQFQHLRYLVAVADERHFGRAADRLFVSQPSLSYGVKTLERELGTELLRRTPRHVELTEAGRDVVEAARRVLADIDAVSAAAARHRDGEAGTLRIGFEATGAGDLGTAARQRFAERHPHIRTEPRRFEWGGEADALRDRSVDVAFVWLPCDERDLHLEVIATEPRFAGLATGHPLADRAELSILELNDVPLMTTEKAPRFWVDWWAVNPRPDGSRVIWGPSNDNVEECFEQVADGVAACICPASMVAFYRRSDLAWIPITDVEPLRIALGWLEGAQPRAVEAFAAVVRELADARRARAREEPLATPASVRQQEP